MHNQRLKKLTDAAVFALLIVLGGAFLAPFAWMVSTSLKPLNETMSLPPRWIPSTFQWHNYPTPSMPWAISGATRATRSFSAR